jgi:hypothetical protein
MPFQQCHPRLLLFPHFRVMLTVQSFDASEVAEIVPNTRHIDLNSGGPSAQDHTAAPVDASKQAKMMAAAEVATPENDSPNEGFSVFFDVHWFDVQMMWRFLCPVSLDSCLPRIQHLSTSTTAPPMPPQSRLTPPESGL